MNLKLHTLMLATAFSIPQISAFAAPSVASRPVTQVQALRVTSDATPEPMDVKVLLDANGAVVGIKTVTTKESKAFAIAGLKSGIILVEQQGEAVVKISSPKFDNRNGGPLQMTYLNNALDGSHRSMDLEIDRQGARWILSTNDSSGRRAFTTMILKARKVFGQIVGISQVTVK